MDVAGWIERLTDLGTLPTDSDDVRVRKATLTLWTVLFGLLAATWGTVYLVLGFPVAGSIPFLHLVLSSAGLAAFHKTRRYGFFRASQLGLMLVLPFLMQVSLGGFHASSGVLLWGFIVPLGALMFYGPRQSVPWFAAYLAVVVASAVLDPRIADQARHAPTPTVVTFFILNIGGVALAAYLMLHYFVRERDRTKAALDQEHQLLLREQEKSERLLLNVLPRSIAERLKETDGIIADAYPEVSVMFGDLVDFTELAERLPAERVVDLLTSSSRLSTSWRRNEAWRRSRPSATRTWSLGGSPLGGRSCRRRGRHGPRHARCGRPGTRSGPACRSPSASGSTRARSWPG